MAAKATTFGYNANMSINEISVSELISTKTKAFVYCPNRCKESSGGCHCNGDYPKYGEYKEW